MSRLMHFTLLVLAVAAFAGTSCAQKSESTHAGRERGHAWLGVSLQDVTPRLAREEGLPATSGTLVSDVAEDSPAEKAGVSEGDVIVSFNGKDIEDSEALVDAVAELTPGTKVDVTVFRKSGKTTLSATLGKQENRDRTYSFSVPDVPRIPAVPHIKIVTRQDILGFSLTTMSKQLAEYFEVPKGRGVLVDEVEDDSPAAKAGLKAGDVITGVDGSTTRDPGDVTDALTDATATARVPVDIIRRGKAMKLELDATQMHKERRHKNRFYWRDEDMSWSAPEQEKFKRDMAQLKTDLKRMGRELGMSMRELGRKIRAEISSAY